MKPKKPSDEWGDEGDLDPETVEQLIRDEEELSEEEIEMIYGTVWDAYT
jgi:hypothetical protein